MGIRPVADDLRPNENDQLGALGLVGLMPEGVAETGNLVEYRNGIAGAVLLLADKARQQYRLAVRDRDLALDPSFGDRRRQAASAGRRHVADLLLDIESHASIDADARGDPQDDAGVAIVDSVDDGIARRQHRGAAGG